MKAYVIKTESGKYVSGLGFDSDALNGACLFPTQADAKAQLLDADSGEIVVRVDISEVITKRKNERSRK